MGYAKSEFENTYWQILSGDVYVSSAGDDTAGTGSPTQPYATIAKGVIEASAGEVIVVGAGEYYEEIDFDDKAVTIKGDGLVVLDGKGVLETAFASADATMEIYDLEIRGYVISALASYVSKIIRCRIFGDSATTELALPTQSKSSLYHTLDLQNLGVAAIENCTLVACTSSAELEINILGNTIFNETTSLEIDEAELTFFDYCNQEPGSLIMLNSVNYTSASSVHTAFSTFQEHGLSVMCNFVKPSIGDYSIWKTNSLFTSGQYTQYIGAYGSGFNFHKLSSTFSGSVYFMQDMSYDSVETDSMVIDEDIESGYIETKVFDLGAIQKLGKMSLFASDVFEITPSSLIKEEQQSEFSPRLVSYEMKFGLTGSEASAADYKQFICNQVPKLDATDKSNGEIDFDKTTARSIVARFVRFKINVNSNQVFLVQENLDCLLQENDDKLMWKI